MTHESTGMQACIRACSTCHQVCLGMVRHCLEKGGVHAEADHIGLLLDCSQICATSADFMLRGSKHHAHTCAECADVCENCAADCERIADDAEMHNCADTCRRCADLCREMAGAMAH